MRVAEAKARKKVLQGLGAVPKSASGGGGSTAEIDATKPHLVDHVWKLRQFSSTSGAARSEQKERFEEDDEMKTAVKTKDRRHHLRKNDYTQYVEALMRQKGNMGK